MQDQMTPEYKQWCPNPLKVKIAQKTLIPAMILTTIYQNAHQEQ